MQNLTETLQGLKLHEAKDSNFIAKAILEINQFEADVDVSHSKTIDIPFELDINYSSWGINDIKIRPTGKLKIEYEETDWETDKKIKRELDIDLENHQVTEWEKGEGYSIVEIRINLSKDGKVQNIELVGMYIDPNKI